MASRVPRVAVRGAFAVSVPRPDNLALHKVTALFVHGAVVVRRRDSPNSTTSTLSWTAISPRPGPDRPHQKWRRSLLAAGSRTPPAQDCCRGSVFGTIHAAYAILTPVPALRATFVQVPTPRAWSTSASLRLAPVFHEGDVAVIVGLRVTKAVSTDVGVGR